MRAAQATSSSRPAKGSPARNAGWESRSPQRRSTRSSGAAVRSTQTSASAPSTATMHGSARGSRYACEGRRPTEQPRDARPGRVAKALPRPALSAATVEVSRRALTRSPCFSRSSKASTAAAQHARSLLHECSRLPSAPGVAASLAASVTDGGAVACLTAAAVFAHGANTARRIRRDVRHGSRPDAGSRSSAGPGSHPRTCRSDRNAGCDASPVAVRLLVRAAPTRRWVRGCSCRGGFDGTAHRRAAPSPCSR
jgi:hypothetical protein